MLVDVMYTMLDDGEKKNKRLTLATVLWKSNIAKNNTRKKRKKKKKTKKNIVFGFVLIINVSLLFKKKKKIEILIRRTEQGFK